MPQELTPLTLTDSNFDQEVLQVKDTLVIVDFWAVWCGPCRIMEPILDEVIENYKNNPKIKVGKVNVDENDVVTERYSIRSIPTTKFFLNGEEATEDILGAVPKEVIVAKINQVLEKVEA